MTDPDPSISWRVRAFVLTGVRRLGGIWFWATVWTVLAAFACALRQGFRHGDWSAFDRYDLPEDSGDRFDWATKTGRYAYLRDVEDRDPPHGHGPST